MHSTLFNQRFPYTDIQLWTGTTTGSQGAHPGWMCMDLPLGTALTYRVNHSSGKLSTNSSTFRLGCFSPPASDFIVIGVIHWKSRNVTHTVKRKEGNVLFNDALNTFYLRLYGVRHMVKEGNVLFNDALNTFYLRLYGVRHMVKEGNVLFNDALNIFYLPCY